MSSNSQAITAFRYSFLYFYDHTRQYRLMSRYISAANCKDKVKNRFQLVLLAAKRARQLERGYARLIENDNHKHTITSINEIIADKVTLDNIDTIENQNANSNKQAQ